MLVVPGGGDGGHHTALSLTQWWRAVGLGRERVCSRCVGHHTRAVWWMRRVALGVHHRWMVCALGLYRTPGPSSRVGRTRIADACHERRDNHTTCAWYISLFTRHICITVSSLAVFPTPLVLPRSRPLVRGKCTHAHPTPTSYPRAYHNTPLRSLPLARAGPGGSRAHDTTAGIGVVRDRALLAAAWVCPTPTPPHPPTHPPLPS